MTSPAVAPRLVHELIAHTATRTPAAPALLCKDQTLTYAALATQVAAAATAFTDAGLGRGQRLAVYLPKRPEAVVAMFAASTAGAVFIPVNPLLKPAQVHHILRDSGAVQLVTSPNRWRQISASLPAAGPLADVFLVDPPAPAPEPGGPRVHGWPSSSSETVAPPSLSCPDTDTAAILYTSGSTGQPKGVVLSHQNIVLGAESVANYLGNTSADRLLAALPLSFDYGMSQLTTAFLTGASVVLLDYLLPRDILKAAQKHRITGLAAVPPLWMQLAELPWPESITGHLRYITNSGGAMPPELTRRLRGMLPSTRVFLMYGLTEAFRSTFLDPDLVDRYPDSMGRAIPNAEVLVVHPDGSLCDANEPGELVHRGALVAQGYWNDPDRTAERFRRDPLHEPNVPLARPAVWSGDIVRRDAAGLLYFVSRKDEMIKTSGYRVSPSEVEECVFALAGVSECACTGVAHPTLGQAIVVFAVPAEGGIDEGSILSHCRRQLPAFMVPHAVHLRAELPRNPNGKIDRKRLRDELQASDPLPEQDHYT